MSMNMGFQKATKRSARLRMALIGVAGSGKTYTALSIAQHLGQKIAFLDTERGSASKYSDVFSFDVMEPEVFSPKTYIDAIEAAEEGGYDVIIIDSLSHAWTGAGGALDQVDRAAKRNQTGNTFGAWRDVTPQHNAMVDKMISAKIHIIATMRAKTDYVQEKNDKTGKTIVRKIGMAPIQRDGLEYEFDVVADLDQDNNLLIGKTRCPAIAGMVIPKAGREIATKLSAWLSDGGAPPETPAPAQMPAAAAPSVAAVAPAPGPAPTKRAPVVVEDEFDAAPLESMHCDCGIEAKYVKGKSGNGWVCGHFGSEEPTCSFRMKDATTEPGFDPFGDDDASTEAQEEGWDNAVAGVQSAKSNGGKAVAAVADTAGATNGHRR